MAAEEGDIEKKAATAVYPDPASDQVTPGYEDVVINDAPIVDSGSSLKRSLRNRHMQMIAIGMISSWGDAAEIHKISLQRRRHRCWVFRQYWVRIAIWWTRFLGRFLTG